MKELISSSSLGRAGALLILAFPAFVYAVVLAANSVGMPVGDDYLSILGFLDRWQDSGRWSHWNPHLFFEQYYSHRIPLTRLAAALLATLRGHCDLQVLQAISWAGWLLVLISVVVSRWSSRAGIIWLLPVSLIMMQPQGYTNVLIASGSPGHAWTILFAFWAIQFSRRRSAKGYILAFLLAEAASLCTANGLLVFPVVALACVLHADRSGAAAWLAVGALMWAAYLWGYSVQEQPVAHHSFSLAQLFLNVAVMAGSVLKFGALGVGPIALGGAVLIVLAGFTLWTGRRDDGAHEYFCMMLFLLLSVVMTAFARVGWSAQYMTQDRYRPYGLLMMALLYVRLVDGSGAARARSLVGCSVVSALVFNLLSYAQVYSDLLNSRRWAQASAMSFQFGAHFPMPAFPPNQMEAARALLLKAVGDGLFKPPRLLAAADESMIRNLPRSARPESGPDLRCLPSEAVSGYLIDPREAIAQPESPTPEFGVVFEGQTPVVLPAIVVRARFQDMLSHGRFLSRRYAFVVPENVYVRGRRVLYAMLRLPDGTMSALWSSSVECP